MELYRGYAPDGDLLYVGISLTAIGRAVQHKASSPWWPLAHRLEIEAMNTKDRELAEDVEHWVIQQEKPRFNIAKTTRSTRPRRPSPPMCTCLSDDAIENAVLGRTYDCPMHGASNLALRHITRAVRELNTLWGRPQEDTNLFTARTDFPFRLAGYSYHPAWNRPTTQESKTT